MRNIIIVTILIFTLYLFSNTAYAQNVYIEYFHSSECEGCQTTDPIISQIAGEYKNNSSVNIEYIDVATRDGLNRTYKYNFSIIPMVIINNETKVASDKITQKNLNEIIDAYIDNKSLDKNAYYNADDFNTKKIDNSLQVAFIFGIMSGFSPCLMAVLAFIMSYTAGNSQNPYDGILKATFFGLGLTLGYILMGVCIIIFGGYISQIRLFTIIAGIISIVIGIYLMGIIKLPQSFNDSFKQISKKSVTTIGGICGLGLLFSFIKIPCSMPMLFVLIDELLKMSTFDSIVVLIVYCIGILTPFLFIGLIGGYALAEKVRSYRPYINMINGIVVIILGVFVIIT